MDQSQTVHERTGIVGSVISVFPERTVTIFNITNHYRLLTAIHYNHQIAYVLLLLTHNEYDQAHWKKNL